MQELEERRIALQKRSLHIVLVLSIIGSGFAVLSNLVTGMMLPTLKMMYETGAMTFPKEMTIYVEMMLDTPRSFFLCDAILYAMSLGGVILMWNLRKSGFHMYTLAQLLILLVTVLFRGREMLGLGDVMLTLLFITYYYIAFRNLGVFNRNTETADNGDNDIEKDENNG